ncbi:hypothetical protein Droror1_Dr00002436 [Drosera rotundifolia]
MAQDLLSFFLQLLFELLTGRSVERVSRLNGIHPRCFSYSPIHLCCQPFLFLQDPDDSLGYFSPSSFTHSCFSRFTSHNNRKPSLRSCDSRLHLDVVAFSLPQEIPLF